MHLPLVGKYLVVTGERGRFVIDTRKRTSVEGTFAAGDVITELVLISVCEGAKAALTAYAYLLEKPGQQRLHRLLIGLGEVHPSPFVTIITIAP